MEALARVLGDDVEPEPSVIFAALVDRAMETMELPPSPGGPQERLPGLE